MSSKTRKLIWSVPLVATLAVVGALAVFVALGLPNANPAEAQGFESTAPITPVIKVEVGNQMLTVTWDAPSNGGEPITSYTIEYKLTSATNYTAVVGPANARRFVITDLTNTLAYNVRLKATNSVGDSDYGVFAPSMPSAVTPAAPASVSISAITDAGFTVSWTHGDNGGAGITRYVVRHRLASATEFIQDNVFVGDNATDRKRDITELDDNMAYHVEVALLNAKSVGDEDQDNPQVNDLVAVSSMHANFPKFEDVQVRTKRQASISVEGAAKISGFSSSPNGQADLSLVMTLPAGGTITGMPIGSSVVLFLEDDFQVPGTISPSDVFFTQNEPNSNGSETGSGAPASADRVIVDSDDFAHTGDDAHTIRIYVPDMDPSNETESGLVAGKFTLRITKEAGIRNDTQAGTYEVAYQLLSASESIQADFETKLEVNDGSAATSNLAVLSKVALSDENNKRDYELTIVGSGLNSGRTATAYVLEDHDGSMPTSCEILVNLGGESVGSATVGSDHTAVVVDTVTTDNYSAGMTNYICMRDDNSPMRGMTTVKPFEMEASISASPTEVNSGDEVTVSLRDFPGFDSDGEVTLVSLAGEKIWDLAADPVNAPDHFDVDVNASDKELTFNMPGGVSGSVEISVAITVDGATKPTSKQATITVNPSGLMLSKSEVAPNESIVISGSGFSESSKIFASMILIDGKALDVDEAGTEGTGDDEHVVTTSSGQFTATVNIWHDGAGNPALDADTYTIKITDENGYEGETTITILEPTLMVTPQIAGPRDYILITGANWPVTTSDADHEVSIELDDKSRSASIDSTGRFNYEYQLSGGIDIGAQHDIVVSFTTRPDIGDIEETIIFSVPSSNVVIIPPAAAPGQTIQLELSGMPIYERVNEVVIDGGNRLGGTAINTDSEGNVTITGIVIPFADPGFYPVKIVVGTGGSAETAIVQLEILAEDTVRGTASPLPEAVMDLGDSVVRIFHFNTRSKVWTFYDPREEFEGLNSLTELAAGQPYSILVSENVENVVLNGRTRDLTCVGDDCWNQLVW